MRKKIPAAIIIFASLSSIIMAFPFSLFFAQINTFDCMWCVFTILFILFWSWIITITFLILLNNWARIAYIIIHIILALITLFICFGTFLTYALAGGPKENSIILVYVSILTPLAISYFLIANIYFLRSNTVKLFKE